MTGPFGPVEILVVGEINPDLIVLGVSAITFGQREDLVTSTTVTVGSSVAITACALSRLGTATGIVGVVGDDPLGHIVLAKLVERAVSIDRVRTVTGGRTGSSVILVEADERRDRHILTDAGVMGDLVAGDVDLDRTGGLRHLHIGSWFLHSGAVVDFPALLEEAVSRGLSTSVDPNDDPARRWDSHLARALPHVGTFFCNESEVLGIAGTLGSDRTADAHRASRRVLAHLAPGGTVVLKCGARGAYAHTADEVLHVTAPRMDVLDTIGAGDTLSAAFLHARLRGDGVPRALRLAVAAGSLSTRRSGGVDGQPTLQEATECAALLDVTATRPPESPRNPPGSPDEQRTPRE